MNKDIIDNVKAESSVIYPTTDNAVYSDSVDAKGKIGQVFVLDPRDDSSAKSLAAHEFNDYDELNYTIQESDDDVSFSDISTDKYLPTDYDSDRPIENPDSGLQKIGCRDCKRYLRVKVEVDTANSFTKEELALIVMNFSEPTIKPAE